MTDQHALGRLALIWRRSPRRLRVIAHRGFGGCRPENTMSAFRFCLGRCRMVELDLRLSADGEVVVCHDDTLERTSDAAERAAEPATGRAPEPGSAGLRVDGRRLAELRRLDMGCRFRPLPGAAGDAAWTRPTREIMPTLAETLAWAKKFAMPLNLELKRQKNTSQDARLARAVARRIAAAGATELTLLSSFSCAVLEECLQAAPQVSRALLYAGPPPADLFDRLAALRACACHPEQHDADGELLRRLRAAGYFVNVWTVNDPARQRELAALGADGLITDYPTTPLG